MQVGFESHSSEYVYGIGIDGTFLDSPTVSDCTVSEVVGCIHGMRILLGGFNFGPRTEDLANMTGSWGCTSRRDRFCVTLPFWYDVSHDVERIGFPAYVRSFDNVVTGTDTSGGTTIDE